MQLRSDATGSGDSLVVPVHINNRTHGTYSELTPVLLVWLKE